MACLRHRQNLNPPLPDDTFLFFQINECLGSVWELHEYKLMAQQSKTESLKEALKAADEEISHQKSLNTQLEIEVCNLY